MCEVAVSFGSAFTSGQFMGDNSYAPAGFNLGSGDLAVIESLKELIRTRLTRMVQSGEDLIGLGEAWVALQDIGLSLPNVNVEVSVGFRAGSDHFEEGVFCVLRVSDEEVRLDMLRTTYSSDVGSDHSSRVVALCSPTGGFSGNPDLWLDELASVLNQSGAELSVSRDHA